MAAAAPLNSGARHADEIAQALVPVRAVQRQEQRAAGVGCIGDVQASIGQLPGQPGVDGAEGQFAALGSGMMTSVGLGMSDWLVICCIPLAGVLLAVVTARLTVLSALRGML